VYFLKALKVLGLLFLLTGPVCLSACGMRGDLYLPDEKSEQVKQKVDAE
jgi:predicted small lipoprotein YifL